MSIPEQIPPKTKKFQMIEMAAREAGVTVKQLEAAQCPGNARLASVNLAVAKRQGLIRKMGEIYKPHAVMHIMGITPAGSAYLAKHGAAAAIAKAAAIAEETPQAVRNAVSQLASEMAFSDSPVLADGPLVQGPEAEKRISQHSWTAQLGDDQVAAITQRVLAGVRDELAGVVCCLEDVIQRNTQDMRSQMVEAMTMEMRRMWNGAMLRSELSLPQTAPAPAEDAPAAASGSPQSQVTIVGLLNDQAKMIESEFSNRFHLRFVSSGDQRSQRISALCKTSARMVVMTGFISHKTESVIHSSKGNLLRVNGGMTGLRRALDQLSIATH